jgi:hypothetical protein
VTPTELADACAAVAHEFRRGHDAAAGSRFAPVTAALDATLRAGVLDPAATEPVLLELLAAYERGDLLLVADVLEHVIAPSLRG